jgi:hypothetical protein
LHNAEGSKPAGTTMARKKKRQKFSATKAVKSRARDLIGSPPPVHRIPSLKDSRKANKHKPTLGEILSEGE